MLRCMIARASAGMRALDASRMLCRRLLGWPASESGRLCRGDRGHGRGHRRRRALMLAILMKRVNVITNEGTTLCARRLRISSLFSSGAR
jgi:hypothetical protein